MLQSQILRRDVVHSKLVCFLILSRLARLREESAESVARYHVETSSLALFQVDSSSEGFWMLAVGRCLC
jgi:hypothetical protein